MCKPLMVRKDGSQNFLCGENKDATFFPETPDKYL